MRDIVLAIASLAGAAVLTALAIFLRPDSPFWKWILWGGIAIFVACAVVLFIDYFKPGKDPRVLTGLGFGLILAMGCAIALIFEPSTNSESLDNTISIQCDPATLPEIVPGSGALPTLSLYAIPTPETGSGRSSNLSRSFASPGSATGWSKNSFGYRCQVKNYGKGAIFNFQTAFKIEFREMVKINEGSAKQSDEIQDSYEHRIAIPALKSDASETFAFYIVNMSSYSANVTIPTSGSLSLLGNDERRTVKFMPQTFVTGFFLPPLELPKQSTAK